MSLDSEQPKSSFWVFLLVRKIRGRSSTQLEVSCLMAKEVFKDWWNL